MTQHSLIEHKANYFFVRLEDDYLAIYEQANQEKDSKGPADCKAMITSVLEGWMNSKRSTAKNEDDLWVYFTYDEWEMQLRGRYKRSAIIASIKEMVEQGTIQMKPYLQNTYAYQLNIDVVQNLINALPEQSPYNPKPRPILGRPRKNHPKINDIKKDGFNLNDFNSDGISVLPSENKSNNEKYRLKTDAPFYTQITNTDLSNTQITNTPLQEISSSPVAPLQSGEKGSASEPPHTDALNTPTQTVMQNDTPAGQEKPKRARKPKPQKAAIDEETQKRIGRVYAFFSKLGQEATKDPTFTYSPSEVATEEIIKWLATNPTEEILREVYFELWNEKPGKTGFHWQKNMTIKAVLGQYTTRSMTIRSRLNQTKRETTTEQPKQLGWTEDRARELASQAIEQARVKGHEIQATAEPIGDGLWCFMVEWNTARYDKPEPFKAIKRWDRRLREMHERWIYEERKVTVNG